MAARILVTFTLLMAGGLAVHLIAAPKPKELPSDPVSEAERKYLAATHRNTVEFFIDRPGFGIRRIQPKYEDIIAPPKPLESNDQGSIVDAKKPAKDKDQDAHFSFQDAIKGISGEFAVRDNEVWSVRKVQLVGLTKNPKPVVYDAKSVPGMKDAKDIPTRELDAFEKKALEELKSGATMHVHRTGADMRAMGPIYAGKQCLGCHEKPGELLGAFTYVLERKPAAKVVK